MRLHLDRMQAHGPQATAEAMSPEQARQKQREPQGERATLPGLPTEVLGEKAKEPGLLLHARKDAPEHACIATGFPQHTRSRENFGTGEAKRLRRRFEQRGQDVLPVARRRRTTTTTWPCSTPSSKPRPWGRSRPRGMSSAIVPW